MIILGYNIGVTEPQAPNPYHHGHLREALVRAAVARVEAVGHESLSMAALAKELGVSQPASYRHFADRDALLSAVAAEGFHLFGATLRGAVANLPASEALAANARAYLDFGRAHGGLYRLMFGTRLLAGAAPASDLAMAARGSFEELLKALGTGSGRSDGVREAIAVWSSLHGLVLLEHYGLLSSPRTRAVPIADVLADLLAGKAYPPSPA